MAMNSIEGFMTQFSFSLVDAVLVVLFLATVIAAVRRGFVLTVSRLVSLVGAILCAKAFSYLLIDPMKEAIVPWLRSRIQSSLSGLAQGTTEATEALWTRIQGVIESLKGIGIPINADFHPSESGSDPASLTEAFSAQISEDLGTWLSGIASVLIVFLVSYLILRLAFWLISKLFTIPGLRQLDEVLGFLTGVLLGAVYATIAALLIEMILPLVAASVDLPGWVQPGIVSQTLTGWLH